MKVIVKDIVGYEGLYIIDNLGNVVSLPKFQGRRIHNKYKILKPKLNARTGYLEIYLSKDGKGKTFLLHRLLAKHFIPNTENLENINHINGIKTDNRLENLEWCTKQQNTKHAFENNLGNFKIEAMNRLEKFNFYNSYCKVILEKDGKKFEFNSTKKAAEVLGLKAENIASAIKKGQRTNGYIAIGFKRKDMLTGKPKP